MRTSNTVFTFAAFAASLLFAGSAFAADPVPSPTPVVTGTADFQGELSTPFTGTLPNTNLNFYNNAGVLTAVCAANSNISVPNSVVDFACTLQGDVSGSDIVELDDPLVNELYYIEDDGEGVFILRTIKGDKVGIVSINVDGEPDW